MLMPNFHSKLMKNLPTLPKSGLLGENFTDFVKDFEDFLPGMTSGRGRRQKGVAQG